MTLCQKLSSAIDFLLDKIDEKICEEEDSLLFQIAYLPTYRTRSVVQPRVFPFRFLR
jgi:hypothetical protein